MAIGLYIIGDEILSGRRQDGHFAKVRELLAERGLQLSWVSYLGDERRRLIDAFRRSLATTDIVFSCGGIGVTPDDHTRQAAAAALGSSEARRRRLRVLSAGSRRARSHHPHAGRAQGLCESAAGRGDG